MVSSGRSEFQFQLDPFSWWSISFMLDKLCDVVANKMIGGLAISPNSICPHLGLAKKMIDLRIGL